MFSTSTHFLSCFLSPVSLCFIFCPPICSFPLVYSTSFCLIFSHLILLMSPLYFFFSLPSFSCLLSPSLPFLLLLLFPTSLFCFLQPCFLPSFICLFSFIPFTSYLSPLSSHLLLPFLLLFFIILSVHPSSLLLSCHFPPPSFACFLSSHILCCFPFKMMWYFFFTHPLVFIFALFFHSFLLLSLHPLCVWIIVCSRSPFAPCALKLITFFSNLIFTFYPFLLIRPINCNCLMLLLPILSIVSSPLLSSPLLSSPLLSSPLLPSPLSGAVCCLTWITTFTSSEAPRCLAISKMQVAQVRQGPVLHRSLLGPSLHTQQILHL